MRRETENDQTWHERSSRRDLKDWCITKELVLNRREWKLAIHVSESWSSVSSLLLSFCQVFSHPFSLFWFSVLLSFLLFLFGFLSLFVFPLLFHSCFIPIFSLAHVVSFLTYSNLLGNKRLGCCCIFVAYYTNDILQNDASPKQRNVWMFLDNPSLFCPI
jgi:hypothetical protein